MTEMTTCDGKNDFDQDEDGQTAIDYGGLDCNDVNPEIYFDPNFYDIEEGINDGIVKTATV